MGPPIRPNIAMGRGHKPRAVHQIAQDQAVPEAHNKPRTKQEGPVVGIHQGVALRDERGGLATTSPRQGIVHVQHRDDAYDTDRDEDGLHDASGDVTELKGCAQSLHKRIDDDRGCDI